MLLDTNYRHVKFERYRPRGSNSRSAPSVRSEIRWEPDHDQIYRARVLEVRIHSPPAVRPRTFGSGRGYRSAGAHGLDVAAYRARWRLPVDYPLTAPSYSARRSAMSK